MVSTTRFTCGAIAALCCLGLGACGPKAASSSAPAPAKAQPVAHETELLKLTLTADAVRRLALKTEAVRSGAARRVFATHGEIIAPPMSGGLPASPATNLQTLAAGQAQADGAVGRARAEVAVAQQAFTRAEGLMRDEAGSVRARDEAAAALGVARANLAAAQAQRALLGPGMSAISRPGTVWVRVAALASDLRSIDTAAPAMVRDLGAAPGGQAARPVSTPAYGDATLGTVDLFYAMTNPGAALRVGQRVAVELSMRGADQGLTAPAAAVLRDIYGGEWVYLRTGENTFERRRIEINATQGSQVLIARGLSAGDQVVTAGAAELFGTEFGAK